MRTYGSWGNCGYSERTTGKWSCPNCGLHNDPETDNCWECTADTDGNIEKEGEEP